MLAGDAPPRSIERFARGDRTWFLEVSFHPIVDEGGACVGATIYGRDVTSRIESERALFEARRSIDRLSVVAGRVEMADGALHDLGNALNGITVGVASAQEQVRAIRVAGLQRVVDLLANQHDLTAFLTVDPRGQRVLPYLVEVARMLERDRDALVGLLDGLQRDVSVLTGVVDTQQAMARRGGTVEVADLAEVAGAAIDFQAESYVRHQVELVRELEPLPRTTLDRQLVLQILLNLLNNARQAMRDHPGDKRVTVRSWTEDGAVYLSVRDTGVGIAPDDLARVWEHGYTTKRDGHGFGLPASLRAARMQGGDLVARSNGPGTGAEFVLMLPIAVPGAEAVGA